MRLLVWPSALALALSLSLIARAAPAPAAPTSDIPDLSADVIKSGSALNASQQKKLDDWVRAWTDRLISGEDDQVTEARSHLVDMFERGGTPVFLEAYIRALSPQLGKALAVKERTIVRLNAMIVASKQIDASTIGLIRTALQDPNPGVRYWAGKAMVALVTAPQNGRYYPSAADLKALLNEATAQLGKEESDQVVEPLIAAIVEIPNNPEAIDQLINEFNKRVGVKALTPGAPLSVDERGLARVFRVLVERAAAVGAKVPPATLHRFALVAYRFMTLATVELSNNQVQSLPLQRQYAQMVDTCDRILKWVAEQQGVTQGVPAGQAKPLVDGKDWPALLLRAQQWNNVLHGKPFNFTEPDLEVNVSH